MMTTYTDRILYSLMARVLFLVGFCQLIDLAAPELGVPVGFGSVALVLASALFAKAARGE